MGEQTAGADMCQQSAPYAVVLSAQHKLFMACSWVNKQLGGAVSAPAHCFFLGNGAKNSW